MHIADQHRAEQQHQQPPTLPRVSECWHFFDWRRFAHLRLRKGHSVPEGRNVYRTMGPKNGFAPTERNTPFVWTTHCAPTERWQCLRWISYKHLAALRPGSILSANFRNSTLVVDKLKALGHRSLFINLFLDHRHGSACFTADRGITNARNGIDKVFDQWCVQIRCGRPRFIALA